MNNMNVYKIAAPQKLLPEDPGFQCVFLSQTEASGGNLTAT